MFKKTQRLPASALASDTKQIDEKPGEPAPPPATRKPNDSWQNLRAKCGHWHSKVNVSPFAHFLR